VQQSIALAQKLMASEKDAAELRRELTSANQTVAAAQVELKKAEERLVHLKQPQAYLVDTIRQRDRTLEEFKAQVDGARRENVQLSKELSETEIARRNAENDLKKLLSQRHQLQTLQGIVRDLAQQPAGVALLAGQAATGAPADTMQGMHSPNMHMAMTTPKSGRQAVPRAGSGADRPPGTPQWYTKLPK
jgi:hypothetical protein